MGLDTNPIPYNPKDLACGFSRSDGESAAAPLDTRARLGTKSAADQIKVTSKGGSGIANFPIEELADSPTIEFAEQDTATHTHRMSWTEAITRSWNLYRGIVRTDDTQNTWRILSTNIQREKGGTALFRITEECKTLDMPPDRFSVTPVELGIHIIKHPRYIDSFLGNADVPGSLYSGDSTGGYGSLTEQANQMVIRLLQDYMENTNYAFRNAITKLLDYSIGNETGSATQPPEPTWDTATNTVEYDGADYVKGTDMAKRAALEIITKYWRGEETPSIVGWQITWTQYFAYPQPINPGGYMENPITDEESDTGNIIVYGAVPALPAYFWSTNNPPDEERVEDNIFKDMARICPQSYSADGTSAGEIKISWRREADQIDYERTWFAITHKWSGSPYGHWDEDFYTQNDRPASYTDFRELNVV